MKVLVTGSGGLLGTALREFAEKDWIFVDREMGDLTNPRRVKLLFKAYQPEYIIHTAAKVGGISLNSKHPETMFYENILMNTLMVHEAALHKVKKFIGFGSTCTFDRFKANESVLDCSQVQWGEPYHMNYGYGYAKRMLDVNLKVAKEEYGLNYTYVVPVSMFGENDNFNLESGHVIPSLIAKAHKGELSPWGDGSASRQVIYSKDAAKIVVSLLQQDVERVLLGSPDEVTIKTMVKTIAKHMDFKGKIVWQKDKPNGQLKRPYVKPYSDFAFTPFDEAIKNTCEWFKANYESARC